MLMASEISAEQHRKIASSFSPDSERYSDSGERKTLLQSSPVHWHRKSITRWRPPRTPFKLIFHISFSVLSIGEGRVCANVCQFDANRIVAELNGVSMAMAWGREIEVLSVLNHSARKVFPGFLFRFASIVEFRFIFPFRFFFFLYSSSPSAHLCVRQSCSFVMYNDWIVFAPTSAPA